MADIFRTYVRFTPNHVRVDEDEFDRFSQAAFELEEGVPEIIECHVTGDLDSQVIDVECVVAAADEAEAQRIIESASGSIAHRVDILAGRATLVGSMSRTERLLPA